MTSPPVPPRGHIVPRMGQRLGWPVEPGVNLLLEGESDARYFRLADRLFHEAIGRCLLGDGFTAYAVGIDNAGGTPNLRRWFATAMNNANLDIDDDGLPIYRFAALLDGDIAGKEAARALTHRDSGFKMWQDVFVMYRVYPKDTTDPQQLQRKIDDLNAHSKQHACEMEDLLPESLVDDFA